MRVDVNEDRFERLVVLQCCSLRLSRLCKLSKFISKRFSTMWRRTRKEFWWKHSKQHIYDRDCQLDQHKAFTTCLFVNLLYCKERVCSAHERKHSSRWWFSTRWVFSRDRISMRSWWWSLCDCSREVISNTLCWKQYRRAWKDSLCTTRRYFSRTTNLWWFVVLNYDYTFWILIYDETRE